MVTGIAQYLLIQLLGGRTKGVAWTYGSVSTEVIGRDLVSFSAVAQYPKDVA